MAWPRAWLDPRGAPGVLVAAAEFGLDLESLPGLVHTTLSATCKAALIFWAMSISCYVTKQPLTSDLTATTSQTDFRRQINNTLQCTHLWVKLSAAAAVLEQVDFSFHLLVLIQSCLFVAVIVEEYWKVQVNQWVGSARNDRRRRVGDMESEAKFRRVEQQWLKQTHSSSITACS